MANSALTTSPERVIDFWFTEIDEQSWWKKDEKFDAQIRARFGTLHQQAIACELADWRNSPQGSLAEVVVLDQFSRNMFRDTPQAFAWDPQALVLAQVAIAKGYDRSLTQIQRAFLYLPFMHSESAHIHDQALQLYEVLGLEKQLEFELKHKVIIDKFGRYPHRNAILGRESTPEELLFLQQPGSGF